MGMRELAERFFQNSLRMDAVILLAGLADSPESPAFEGFIELLDEGDLVRLFGMAPHLEAEILGTEDAEALWDWCSQNKKLGFLVKFATPVMRPLTAGSSVGSWGSFYTHWVYADTMDLALEAGFVWASERRMAEKGRRPA